MWQANIPYILLKTEKPCQVSDDYIPALCLLFDQRFSKSVRVSIWKADLDSSHVA